MPTDAMRTLTKPALNPHETWWASLSTAATAANLLRTETAGGRYQRSVYELFAEMEEKDGHLHSVIQTRLNGLLGLDRSIQPATGTETACATARSVEELLGHIPRFDDFLRALLDGLAKGFAVVELLWGYDKSGRLAPLDWIAHPQEFFLFDRRGRLLLLAPPFKTRPAGRAEAFDNATGRATVPASSAYPAPPRKFIALVFGRDPRNPYGRGLAQRAYWYYWFKKNNLKHWAVHNEKHGSPTTIATYQSGTPEEERRRLLEVLESIQTDAGVVVPETVTLGLLETARSGDGRTYREMADWCNDEMSKIVLGATLTVDEGRRSGSLALGNVHETVRRDYIESDARLLATLLEGTLLRWIAELNALPGPVPRFAIDTTPPEDLEKQARIDSELLKMGVPLSLRALYDRYGRTVPAAEERVLTYDDSNLFQYHLQHGIVTINEVRKRLHLEPVPWGGGRTAVRKEEYVPVRTGPSLEEIHAGLAESERLGETAETGTAEH